MKIVVSLFIDSGVKIVVSLFALYHLRIWFVLAPVLNSKNNFIIVKLKIWGWCGVAIMNRQIVYKCLLTNRLHGKPAELCLADS